MVYYDDEGDEVIFVQGYSRKKKAPKRIITAMDRLEARDKAGIAANKAFERYSERESKRERKAKEKIRRENRRRFLS